MDSKALPALDLRQLHYFVALAEHGSISSAAAALGLAQPSLSENIARLERRMEVQLIIRTKRGVQLTNAGRALVKHGREIVATAAAAIAEVRQLGGDASGPVSIGLTPSLGLLLSVPLAETIQNELPLVRLRIAEALSGDIMDWLVSERLDLGCVYETSDSSLLSFQPLLQETLFLVTASDNIPDVVTYRDGAPTITGLSLVSLPLVLPSTSHGARKVVERFARSAGLQMNVVLEIDSLPQIISMVGRASAYTILPQAAVINQVASGQLTLVAIVEPTMSRTAYLARKRSRPVSRASSEVETAVKLIIQEMIDRFKLPAQVPPTSPVPDGR